MSELDFITKLQKLTNRFYIYCDISPVSLSIIDIYDLDKLGFARTNTLRRYKADTFEKAILKAYALEFENKVI